jgi:uncharacterized protein (TIGR03118 family)
MGDSIMSKRTLFARHSRSRRSARPRLELLDGRDLPSGYFQTNLASDVPGQAQVHDPELVDSWGLSLNPTGTFWPSARATDVSTVYSGDFTRPDGTFAPFVKGALTVTIPGGAPTGQVFNGSNDFVVTAPRPPAPILDPEGDFLPTYEGPLDPALDVVAHEVRIVGDRLEFFGRMAGPIGVATQPENGFYLFGIDRGLGTARFLAGSPIIGPNVTWDIVVRVNRDGTGHINHPLTGLRTLLDPADIQINGNELIASVPLSQLTPAPAPLRPPEQWTYNLWPRIGEIRGQNQLVSDLAPDDGNSPVRAQISGPARFIFASETGHITGWNNTVPSPPIPSRVAHIMATTPGAVYTGLAIGNNGTSNYLYAADFVGGKIDVFDREYKPTGLAGSFVDPDVPVDYDPFNIWNLGGKLYIAYAQQLDGDALPDGGTGFVSVFDTNGNFLHRLVSEDHLDKPFGLALAPANFGEFSNAVLVGNRGDGRINAYDASSGDFLGPLRDGDGDPIVIDGLMGLHFGNGVTSGDKNALYFAAGPEGGAHGLFGSLRLHPARVASVVVNDGAAQRSMVKSLTVTFDGPVSIDAGAFELHRQDGTQVDLTVATSMVNGRTRAVLTFAGAGVVAGSLADGNYALMIRGNLVHDAMGRALDGDGDGAAGGDRTDSFHRLYGDSDGDRDVDLLDLGRFLSTLGRRPGDPHYLAYFDVNGDERIGLVDVVAFAQRLGSRLNP